MVVSLVLGVTQERSLVVNELWIDVVGYEGFYQVSPLGYIRSVDRVITSKEGKAWKSRPMKGCVLKPCPYGRCKHLGVTLCVNGFKKMHFVHKLVMLSFVGVCPDGKEVRHLDGNVNNNKLSNLAYGTPKENQADRILHGTDCRGSRNPIAVLVEQDVIDIKRRLRLNERNIDIARLYGVTPTAISLIRRGINWAWLQE
jgi:HNH endonuclease/NUMOD4 motif